MIIKHFLSLRSALLIAGLLLVSACGQKGPLILEPRPDLENTTQEGLPNEISPEDGSESESEAETEAPEPDSE